MINVIDEFSNEIIKQIEDISGTPKEIEEKLQPQLDEKMYLKYQNAVDFLEHDENKQYQVIKIRLCEWEDYDGDDEEGRPIIRRIYYYNVFLKEI